MPSTSTLGTFRAPGFGGRHIWSGGPGSLAGLVLGVWLRCCFYSRIELRLSCGYLLVTLLGTIFWRLATGFAGNASFLTHLIKSLLNASGGVIDSLLSRETRRFVLLELLLFGRINVLFLASVS